MWREGLFLLETIPYPLTVGVYTCSVSARLKLRCQTGPQGVGLQEQEWERKTFKLPLAILYSSGDRHGGLCFDKWAISYVWMLIKIQSELPGIFLWSEYPCLHFTPCLHFAPCLQFASCQASCMCKTRSFQQQWKQLDTIRWRKETLP